MSRLKIERKLPVLYIRFEGHGYPLSPSKTPVVGGHEYVPRPLQCRECAHWKCTQSWEFDSDGARIVERERCTSSDGLKKPKRDGVSGCSYAEPRESEG